MTRLKTADLFDGLEPEKEKPIRKVERSQTLDETIRGFEMFYKEVDGWTNPDHAYARALANVPKTLFAPDISAVLLALIPYQEKEDFDERAGFYLSALCNTCKDSRVSLCVEPLERPIWHLCYKNESKIIRITGDLGSGFANQMSGGKLILEGDVYGESLYDHENSAEQVSGGTIIIRGDVDDSIGNGLKLGKIMVKGYARGDVGREMKSGYIKVGESVSGEVGSQMDGGKIIVEDDAHDSVGEGMAGGVIRVKGTIQVLADNIIGGSVYESGRKIVSNGRYLDQ